MAVIVIMLLVAGFSVPRFRRTFDALQLQVFANEVARLLAYANQRAITRGETFKIHFDLQGRKYWLARFDETGKSTRIASKLNRVSPIPDHVLLDASSGEVSFYPDGRADGFELAILDGQREGFRLVTNRWTGKTTIWETHAR